MKKEIPPLPTVWVLRRNDRTNLLLVLLILKSTTPLTILSETDRLVAKWVRIDADQLTTTSKLTQVLVVTNTIPSL